METIPPIGTFASALPDASEEVHDPRVAKANGVQRAGRETLGVLSLPADIVCRRELTPPLRAGGNSSKQRIVFLDCPSRLDALRTCAK